MISRRPELAVGLTVLIWGLNFPIIKVALEVMPPLVVNAGRFGLSVVVLGVMHAASGRDFWRPMRTHPVMIVLLGLLGFVAYQLCFIIGVDQTTAGSAALIIASAPAWTAIGARLVGLERLPPAAWVGIGLGLVGTALVVLGGGGTIDVSADTLRGNLILLVGAVLWATYTVLSRPLMDKGVSATGLAFFGVLISMPILLGLGASQLHLVDGQEVTWHAWAALTFSGLLSTGAAYAWWNAAIRTLGPSQTAIWNNLVPVIALVFGALLLGESVHATQVLGGTAIIGGLLLMRRARLRARTT